jgi:hypothetical protein
MGGFVYRLSSMARRHISQSLVPEIWRIPLVGFLLLGPVLPVTVSLAADSEGQGMAGVSVVSSGPEALRFTVSGLEPVWTPLTVGNPSVTLYEVRMGGFVSSGEPGHPRLPRTGGWVVVPPGTRPELRPIEEQWNSTGARNLMVESVPVIIQGTESWENSASEILVLPHENPPADALLPPAAQEALARRGQPSGSSAVTLSEVTWWRGRRIVSYQMVPVRHDGSGMAVQVLASGTWEIRFVPDETAGRSIKTAHARKTSGRHDDKFGHAFLNGELLKQLPTEAVWLGVDFSSVNKSDPSGLDKVRGGKAGTLLGPESRLAVWKTGLVRVKYSVLRDRGLLPSGAIGADQIRIYQRRYLGALDDGSGQVPYVEIEVPIHMVGEGDNFDGNDFLVFYGMRLRDDVSYVADLGNGPETVPGCGDPWEMNNEANIYWLAASEPEPGQPWSRMEKIILPTATGTPLPGYRRTDHVQEQVAFRENLPREDVDRLYYNTFRDIDVRAGINTLWAPDPADSVVTIKIGVVGKNQVSRPLRFDLVTNSSLTTHLGDVNLASIIEDTLVYTVHSSKIAGNYADIRMYNSRNSRDWVFSYLNWVEISYHSLYQATGDKISFHCGAGLGPQSVVISGFTTSDIGLFEITDPRQPVVVELGANNVSTADNLAWTLSIMPDQSGQTRSFSAVGDFSTDGVDPFPHGLSFSVQNPTDPTEVAGPDPDMIVITHPNFRAELERWKEHRQNRAGGDLNIHVVEVQDLYDWYSGGLKDPWALKRFSTHAITRWNSWVLPVVGDANENVLEKGVLPSARPWAKDWVPTHYHVQEALAFEPELMASDKWYTTLEAGMNYPRDDDFPSAVQSPWAMYTGRFPCNSVSELNRMIDKVMTVENLAPGQTWRRRGIFFADDQWSNGYGAEALSTLVYKYNETVFATSERDSLSRLWSSGSPVALDSVLVMLEDSLDPLFPYDPPPPTPPERDLLDVRRDTGAVATPELIRRLSGGGIVAHYQGHANPYVLSSEFWMEDRSDGVGRVDVPKLGNTDQPWVFMGLGCHISDWAQNTVLTSTRAHERSIAEKFLLKSRSGASAVYCSSGYEYITENRVFGEYIFRRWMVNPPSQRTAGSTVAQRSRWVLGELMWAAEADIYAVNRSSFVQEMISQYVILGDPLMRLDADEPQVTATLMGTPDEEISGEVEISATSASNLRTINIVARDEAGIDRLKLMDSGGQDHTGAVVTETLPPGATDHQEVFYTLEVPVRPFDHDLVVKIWDTAGSLETDRHYELVLKMPQTAVFSSGGEAIDPATFIFPAETLINFNAEVTSAAWLLEYDPNSDFGLTSETLSLTDTEFLLDKNQHLTVAFGATSPTQNADDQHVVILTIDGYPTELVLQQGTATEHSPTIGKVYNFPNPMAESTRFVFESGLTNGDGIIRVFSVAGRPVARIPFRFTGGGSGIVDWDGRDNVGDEMGNGTYLYRVEIDTGDNVVVSDMQRLVMMR